MEQIKYYIVKTEKNNIIWTSKVSDQDIKRFENEYGCRVVSIEWDGLDHSIKVSPEKNDENIRCMNDNRGSRLFTENKFGY